MLIIYVCISISMAQGLYKNFSCNIYVHWIIYYYYYYLTDVWINIVNFKDYFVFMIFFFVLDINARVIFFK